MTDWMSSLASHYETLRDTYPDERLMIVFDIDGTILDMRHIILHALNRFDRNHGTKYFEKVRIPDIDFHEDHLPDLLERLQIPAEERHFIEEDYRRLLSSSASILECHQPFRGVLEAIRWFQMQPKTFVGLNTGRPESMRFHTLRALNRLGHEYRVEFLDGLLFMNDDISRHITKTKLLGIDHFRKLGYRIIAVVDNEPENLDAMSKIDGHSEVLLLHADTIFRSREECMPKQAVQGKHYDFTKLVMRESIPKHTQFVWRCDNTRANLNSFLQSNVRWLEIDLRCFSPYMQGPDEHSLTTFTLDECFGLIKEHKKAIKLNLNRGGLLLGSIRGMIQKHSIDDSSLWFQGSSLVLGEDGFRLLRSFFPSAILQCPVDIFAQIVSDEPVIVKEKLLLLQRWGINRFGISWLTINKRRLISCLRQWGFETDIYNVAAFESFLKALLFLPNSITSRFSCNAAWSHPRDLSGKVQFPPDDSIFRHVA